MRNPVVSGVAVWLLSGPTLTDEPIKWEAILMKQKDMGNLCIKEAVPLMKCTPAGFENREVRMAFF